MKIAQILAVAFICEAVWETAKMFWQDGKISIDRIGALAVGELLAIGTGIDLFAFIEMPIFIPYLGIILTGLLISRGANFVHDILGAIANIQQNNKLGGDA